MDFENLEETLLNAGKEKGAELAENFLDEQQTQQGEGSLAGMGIGYGKNMLENYLGSSAPENPDAEDKTSFAGENSAEMSADEANSNDEKTEDDSDDKNNQSEVDSVENDDNSDDDSDEDQDNSDGNDSDDNGQ